MGQLGLGHTEDVPSPQKVEIPEATLQAGRILFRRMSLTWLSQWICSSRAVPVLGMKPVMEEATSISWTSI
eukprot:g27564.t1